MHLRYTLKTLTLVLLAGTFVEFEASKYFSLGSSDWAKQRIIALNL